MQVGGIRSLVLFSTTPVTRRMTNIQVMLPEDTIVMEVTTLAAERTQPELMAAAEMAGTDALYLLLQRRLVAVKALFHFGNKVREERNMQ